MSLQPHKIQQALSSLHFPRRETKAQVFYLELLLSEPQSSPSLAAGGNTSSLVAGTQATKPSQAETGEASWERGHWPWGFVGM